MLLDPHATRGTRVNCVGSHQPAGVSGPLFDDGSVSAAAHARLVELLIGAADGDTRQATLSVRNVVDLLAAAFDIEVDHGYASFNREDGARVGGVSSDAPLSELYHTVHGRRLVLRAKHFDGEDGRRIDTP